MGQKVHPLGFRVGITKKHQSQWFARFNKYKYSQSILEDRIIRDTLSKLFPELLNPILNNSNLSKKRNLAGGQKEEISAVATPRITQIKIERGLIPYEIGIQIHAENCELLKSAIDNLKVKRELIVKLQKTRRYLLSLKLKLKDLTNNNSNALALGHALAKHGGAGWGLYPQALPLAGGAVSGLNQNSDQEPAVQQTSLIHKSIGSTPIPPLTQMGGVAPTGSESRSKSKTSSRMKISRNKVTGKQGMRDVPFKFRPKLTKQELRRQRLIKKRLKKRQFIRRRYRQLILKGLFIKKTSHAPFLSEGGAKIIQTLSLKTKKGVWLGSPKGSTRQFFIGQQINKTKLAQKIQSISTYSVENPCSVPKRGTPRSAQTGSKQKKNTFSSRIKKKFVTLFIQKMNKKFLSHLKVLLINYGQSPLGSNVSLTSLPLGYSKQWNLNRLSRLKTQPIYKLNRMIVVLEQKLLVKLESLRKEFIAFGSISSQSSESLGYFQILNFLKNLKELVNKLKREQKLQLSISKNSMRTVNVVGNSSSTVALPGYSGPSGHLLKGLQQGPQTLSNLSTPGNNKFKVSQNSTDSLDRVVLQKKLNNIEDECRKVKLIEYIKDIVKKHRSENIYFYLSTMADSGKDLRKIKQFTKRHADFLFGLNLNNLVNTSLSIRDTTRVGGMLPTLINYEAPSQERAAESGESLDITGLVVSKADVFQPIGQKINERVSKVLEKASKKTNFEKTLQDIFLEQIEKQRTMCLQNLQLIPKISIKFYAVNKKTLEQKASIVSESVVDALEKRKAFRKVIKDAKETLMRTPGVKGVKIQVAGRLNGAEIARTEWVRAGRVPLQTLRANLDYSYRTANTIYGIIGVRVWIFKGYCQ